MHASNVFNSIQFKFTSMFPAWLLVGNQPHFVWCLRSAHTYCKLCILFQAAGPQATKLDIMKWLSCTACFKLQKTEVIIAITSCMMPFTDPGDQEPSQFWDWQYTPAQVRGILTGTQEAKQKGEADLWKVVLCHMIATITSSGASSKLLT